MNNLFYQRLTELKNKHGKSYNQVEKGMGLLRNALHNYRRGKHPSADRLFQVADHFNVSSEHLMGKSDIPRRDYIKIALQNKYFKNLQYNILIFILNMGLKILEVLLK